MIRRLAIALFLLAVLAAHATPARADCATVSGHIAKPGEFLYNVDYGVMQYCAGTVWRGVGGAAGTDGPLANLTDVDDALAPTDGDCLVYNNGTGQWETGACGSGGSGDDLGDHTATQNINMAGFNIVGAGAVQVGTSAACGAGDVGAIRYVGGAVPWEYCDGGGTWLPFKQPRCVDDAAGECYLAAPRAGDDPDFTAANIANGINILGVTGSFVGAGAPNCTDNDTATCTLNATRSNGDPDLLPSSIVCNINILGVIGTAGAEPAPFTFTDQTGVALSTLTTSDIVQIIGFPCASAPVAIAGQGSPQYRVCSDASCTGVALNWTSAPNTILRDQYLQLRLTSSASFSTASAANISVGGVNDNWSVTTVAQDTTPDAFSFNDQTGAPLSTLATSNIIQITGITGNVASSISGSGSPQYQICSDASCTGVVVNWTSAANTIQNNQYIRLRLTSSTSYSTALAANMTIGGTADNWSVTTAAQDTTPDAFNFTDQTGVALSTLTTSNIIQITGITGNVATSVSGTGSPQYQVCSDASCTGVIVNWTSAANTIQDNQFIRVRLTASGTPNTALAATMTIGSGSDNWSVTTLDNTPDLFSFNDQTGVALGALATSNIVQITGLAGAIPTSISGGGSPQYRICADAGCSSEVQTWTSGGATIQNSQYLQLRLTASASYFTVLSAIMTVGAGSDQWDVRTISNTPVTILITTTSATPQSWTVPADWNSTSNTIECLGGGGAGRNNQRSGGAGAGAYARTNNLALTPGGTATFQLIPSAPRGSSGGDTWISNTGAAPAAVAQGCLAKGGAVAPTSSGGAGGTAAASIGDLTYSGGNGGDSDTGEGGGGGGGAAGPHGAGRNGGSGVNSGGGGGGSANGGTTAGSSGSGANGGAGGKNRLGTGGGSSGGGAGSNGGGGGGANSGNTGGANSQDIVWTQTSDSATAGPGSGGGGGGLPGGNGRAATNGYGGAGGGGAGQGGGPSDGDGGTGKQGIIVITYTP